MKNITVNKIEYYTYIPTFSGARARIESRSTFGLVLSPEGSARYIQNDTEHICDKNHILLIPKGATYDISYIEGGVCPLINFQCDADFTELRSFYLPSSIELTEEFGRIEKMWAVDKISAHYDAMEFLYKVFAKIHSAETLPEILTEAQSFIAKHYTESEFSVKLASAHLHISEVYLRKLFRSHLNISPIKYINRLRIDRAKILLENKGLSIEQIAEHCGFSSLFSFSRAFKNALGVPPSEYRKIR